MIYAVMLSSRETAAWGTPTEPREPTILVLIQVIYIPPPRGMTQYVDSPVAWLRH